MPGRPQGRQKNIVSGSGKVFKRGSGVNLGGPVGNGGGIGGGARPSGGNRAMRNGGIGFGTIILIVIIIMMLKNCGGGLGGGSTVSQDMLNQYEQYTQSAQYEAQASQSANAYNSSDAQQTLDSLFGGSTYGSGSSGSGFGGSVNSAASQIVSNDSGLLDTSVKSDIRERYTKLKGNGEDIATVMIYMCGTDLESKNAAATHDLQEMLYSELSDKVNLLVYTGGCKKWNNNVVQAGKHQIYKLSSKGMQLLKDNAGSGAMTDAATLSSYIKWAKSNFPADRYELILWDHGAGSISGYGYDETQRFASSMRLDQIKKALEDGGVKFDFVGFDACLMATLETGLMLNDYADYMIASEETEPCDGWYYTDWLTQLSRNTSTPTLEIAKNIADTYYKANARYSSYSGITLSVTDLAELASTVPQSLAGFASSITELVENDSYKTVSNARSNTKEFAASNKIDQIDIADMAQNLGTEEAAELIEAIKGAVKYNITSSNMARAYGLSAYFPYRKTGSVKDISNTYDEIGMDSEYVKCIQTFASQQTAGQTYGGGDTNVFEQVLGSYGSGSSGSSGSSSGYGSAMSSDMLTQMLMQMMGGGSFFDGVSVDRCVDYTTKNSLDTEKLNWVQNSKGQKVLPLEDADWELVDSALLNVLVDDGEGYIDLGLDTLYEWDDNNYLVGEYDNTWLSVNGQPAAYYMLTDETFEDGYVITGYIPAMVNGDRANIMVTFSSEQPEGFIGGYQRYYADGETDTQAKVMEFADGDTIDFICDYYSYEGDFINNYYLGNQMTVNGELKLGNIDISDNGVGLIATYKITDIYNQSYWTPAM